MSCDHLICARCASPVAEGRCPACRAARERLRHRRSRSRQQLITATAALVLALMVVLVLSRMTGR